MGSFQLSARGNKNLKWVHATVGKLEGDVNFGAFLNFDHHCLELFLMTINKKLLQFTILLIKNDMLGENRRQL